MLRTYQPNVRKRKKDHGFRKRMSTANGRKVLRRRRQRGRRALRLIKLEAHALCVFKMKIISIKENSDFKRLYYRGKSVVKKRIVVYYRKNRFTENRLGITVSPKIGCAVVRNRVRRLIKENYRLLQGLNEGYDIVIVARSSSKDSSFDDIGKDLRKALSECFLLKQEID